MWAPGGAGEGTQPWRREVSCRAQRAIVQDGSLRGKILAANARKSRFARSSSNFVLGNPGAFINVEYIHGAGTDPPVRLSVFPCPDIPVGQGHRGGGERPNMKTSTAPAAAPGFACGFASFAPQPWVMVDTVALPEIFSALAGTGAFPDALMHADREWMAKEVRRGNLPLKEVPGERALAKRWGVGRAVVRRICGEVPIKPSKATPRPIWKWVHTLMTYIRQGAATLTEWCRTASMMRLRPDVREAKGISLVSHFRLPIDIGISLWETIRARSITLTARMWHEYMIYLVSIAQGYGKLAPPAAEIARDFKLDPVRVQKAIDAWAKVYPALTTRVLKYEGQFASTDEEAQSVALGVLSPDELEVVEAALAEVDPTMDQAPSIPEAEPEVNEAVNASQNPEESEVNHDKLSRLNALEDAALKKTQAAIAKRAVNVIPKTVRDWFIEAREQFFPGASMVRPWIPKDLAQAKQLLQMGTVAEIRQYVFWVHEHWAVLKTHLPEGPPHPRISDIAATFRFDAWKAHMDEGTVPPVHFSASKGKSGRSDEWKGGTVSQVHGDLDLAEAKRLDELEAELKGEKNTALFQDPRWDAQKAWEADPKGGDYTRAANFVEGMHKQGRPCRHPLETGHYPVAFRLLLARDNAYAQMVRHVYANRPGWEKWVGDEGHDHMAALKAPVVEQVGGAVDTKGVFDVFGE